MARQKSPREKGKVKMHRMFYKYQEGDNVTIVRDISFAANFPKRINGKIGKIVGKRGKFYIIELKDFNEIKHFIISPAHLKAVK